MKKSIAQPGLLGLLLSSVLGATSAFAAEQSPTIVGKDDWLFYRYELSDAADAGATNSSIDLIQRFSKVLAANGINAAVTLVPLKMRVYSEFLPDSVTVNSYMAGNYARIGKSLRDAQVNLIDLNTAFMSSPKRTSDTPLFFRLDTHWTPAGSMLAAETIKIGLDGNPTLKKVLDSTQEEAFKLALAKRKTNSKARDLVEQLPKNSPSFAPEQTLAFSTARTQPAKEDLLGNRAPLPITLLGSSYSSAWTGFPDALRFTLQRDILSISVGADQGSWVGMEGYLRDDAFQKNAPKLLIWELPERDLRAAPDYKFRDARYISDNTEWLLRVSALVQSSCKPSATKAKVVGVGLAAIPSNLKDGNVVVGATSEGDFVELAFDSPIDRLDYLAAQVMSNGSKAVAVEATGPNVPARRFALSVAGDDLVHAFKTPLPSATGVGFAKIRIFPGKNSSFTLQNVQVCRQPEDLLK